jgi:sigma-B regulation protein RsbU (phosphoserine phosphatase)
MLSACVESKRNLFDTLAEAWMCAGASAVALHSEGQVVEIWPMGSECTPDCVTPVYTADGKLIGELCLSGSTRLPGGVVSTRLAADAALIGAIADAHAEMDSVVEALADTEDHLLALYELTRPGASRLNVEQILHATARQATRLVKAEGAFVALGTGQIVQMPTELVASETAAALVERVHAGKHELLLSEAEAPTGWPLQADNLFLAPLFSDENGGVPACLGLWLKRPAATLSPDLKLARSIAEQAGAQLEIALLHQKLLAQAKLEAELDLAREVQLGLLPRRPPQMAGVELYAESRPARQVGGDFYDFYATDPDDRCAHRFSFAVGDVSGKGMSAALLMAMTRTSLRVVTSRQATERSPAGILARANADLYDDFTEVGMMASVFVGQYDAQRSTLTYANDGHSPVLLRPRNGTAHLLEADGPMMGVLPQSLAQDQSLLFGQGDLLVVLTDGFNEAVNECGEMYGMQRLQQLVDAIADLPACEIGRRLFGEMERFAGRRPQEDDQTLIIFKGV